MGGGLGKGPLLLLTRIAMSKEKKLHKAVATYIKTQYPDVIFTSDQSGLKVSIGVAKYMKATRNPNRGIPDLIILRPNRYHAGLMLELKITRNEVFTKNGKMRKSEHIREQTEVLDKLKRLGYAAEFAYGLDDAINKIDLYMNEL